MLALLLLAGCVAPFPEGEGLTGASIFDPFPSALHVRDGRVAVPPDVLPVPVDGTPLPVERLAWRDGFSPVQVSVVRLEGVDPQALPGWREPTPGSAGVRMVDLDSGAFLPVMAELDAHPDAADPALLVRPLQALPLGHRVAVVVTTEAARRPERFDALLNRRVPSELEQVAEHHRALVDDLAALGVQPDEIALAWDFPVGDPTVPLRSALDQLDPPGTWSLHRVRDADAGDPVPPHTWRSAEGFFQVQDFLVDDRTLDPAADGTVQVRGEADADLFVHVPDSVRGAAAGTVPVMVFGHGIFSNPGNYLDSDDDEHGVLALADAAGVIVVATRWRGLNDRERLDAIDVAHDFGTMPMIPDRLLQGVVNQHTLLALATGSDLLDDPVLQGADGQSLVDPDRVVYYGISLGGIEGLTFVASGAEVEAGVLHVGGGAWATMLERSLHWRAFEIFVEETVPDPADRQLLYAASQLYWDLPDPLSWVHETGDTPLLWQEAIGDEQVPNLTTEIVARSAGASLLAPAVREPWGFTAQPGPLGPGSIALAQFDPEVPLPADENRPPSRTHAHDLPRTWPGTRDQAVDFLLGAGEVVHHCGSSPCSASQPGD